MNKKDFTLFLIASAILGISQSLDSAIFNNFLNDTFHISVFQRTLLEIPREFPGFLVVFVSGLLIMIGDVKIAAFANILSAVGMLGLGFLSSEFTTMVAWLAVYSMGTHLFMPVSNSIVMNISDVNNMGKRLGQVNGINTAFFLITSLITALIFKNTNISYRGAFVVAAIAFLLSAIAIFCMSSSERKSSKAKRFVFRKEYNLYYWLSILFGARKQVFITFGPWVLIKVFDQGVSTFALLGFIVAGFGMFFKPIVGYLIDKKGEKFVLAGEAFMLILVCLGYAFAKSFFEGIGNGSLAIHVVYVCFILDQLLAAAGMARSTYLKKIAINPEDVSPTLSAGISIDHVVSMFIPFIGGLIWNKLGYEYVFVAASFIALFNLLATRKINIKQSKSYNISVE